MKIDDIVREINRIPDRDRLLTLEQLQAVAIRVFRDSQRSNLLLREENERLWTVS